MKKININKKKAKKIVIATVSVILTLSIIAGTVAFIANYPDKREAVFNDSDKKPTKQVFDEGKFKMDEYDLIVATNGDDTADGTLEAPLSP